MARSIFLALHAEGAGAFAERLPELFRERRRAGACPEIRVRWVREGEGSLRSDHEEFRAVNDDELSTAPKSHPLNRGKPGPAVNTSPAKRQRPPCGGLVVMR